MKVDNRSVLYVCSSRFLWGTVYVAVYAAAYSVERTVPRRMTNEMCSKRRLNILNLFLNNLNYFPQQLLTV